MPLTIVSGGQFGSEGKGKVVAHLASAYPSSSVVRVGGPNSGHTWVDPNGAAHPLRQLPVTAATQPGSALSIAAGSYVDLEVLLGEIELYGVSPERLRIDSNATIILPTHKQAELDADLQGRFGGTGSGVGAAVAGRALRSPDTVLAREVPELFPYVGSVTKRLREHLNAGLHVFIEGTQGFGLSNLHSRHFPYVTSRDTTAAGALSEVGLSPFDVDEIVLVCRATPIRVAGNSGPLPLETTWQDVATNSGAPGIEELTTVTRKIRRVGYFDPQIVREAIRANRPTRLVLNHVDHLADLSQQAGVAIAREQVQRIESQLDRSIDLIGISRRSLLARATFMSYRDSHVA